MIIIIGVVMGLAACVLIGTHNLVADMRKSSGAYTKHPEYYDHNTACPTCTATRDNTITGDYYHSWPVYESEPEPSRREIRQAEGRAAHPLPPPLVINTLVRPGHRHVTPQLLAPQEREIIYVSRDGRQWVLSGERYVELDR